MPQWLCAAGAFLLVLSQASGQSTAPGGGSPAPSPTEARLQALEAHNRQLQAQVDLLLKPHAPYKAANPGAPVGTASSEAASPLLASPFLNEQEHAPAPAESHSLVLVDLEEGLRFRTADNRIKTEIHNLTQFDGRFFSPTGDPLHSSFVIPRQRLYFSGLIDDTWGFTTIINRGYGSLDILDSYAYYKLNKHFIIRLGRMKAAYGYEYFKTSEGELIAPERSVFVGNLSPNRQLTAMVTGKVLDDTVEYFYGVISGPQRSFQDTNNFKDPFVYANIKPFLHGGSDLLRQANFGFAATYGREDNILEPVAFHTANDETTSSNVDNVSPAFLRFNPKARVVGEKALWLADFNYFYRSMTAQAQYNGGYITYSVSGRKGVRVPYSGWSVAFTYFFTGEELTSRKEVVPLRDFNIHSPLTNTGALEGFVRVANLTAGTQIFNDGLVDQSLWSRSAVVTDIGAHWYPNRFIRLTVDYQRGDFGSPVQLSPTRMTKSMNMLWLRSQLYF